MEEALCWIEWEIWAQLLSRDAGFVKSFLFWGTSGFLIISHFNVLSKLDYLHF